MLFSSYGFLFLFLPVALGGYFALQRCRLALAWLVAASLVFYGWWQPVNVLLLLASVVFNYVLGLLMVRLGARQPGARRLLALGVAANLSLLAYFKYASFLIGLLNSAFGLAVRVEPIDLPLAISFFTFQQIAYLVDVYRGDLILPPSRGRGLERSPYGVLHYVLFVTFFPQLIAGPIVHHGEMIPQFAKRSQRGVHLDHLVVGVTVFFIGLAKKTFLADGLVVYASPVFQAAEMGRPLGMVEAWIGVLAYTFQIYFDFSGYSDMAIGIARMFGVRLPLNFNSPYKAVSVVEFWRRWHMTLSRFLRDYLYIPLGGGRSGSGRRYLNLMVTMVLGGLWHGAGWTFVAWGALHGLYLVIGHLWRQVPWRPPAAPSRLLTFLAVVLAWVFFRAKSFHAAFDLLEALCLPGAQAPLAALSVLGTRRLLVDGIPLLLLSFVVCWGAPNTQQWMVRYAPALETYAGEVEAPRIKGLEWRPTPLWALLMLLVSVLAVIHIERVGEFIYYQF